MKIVLRGLVCEVGYKALPCYCGFFDFAKYLEKKHEMEEVSDFTEEIERTNDYVIYKVFKIVDIVGIKELHNYPAKLCVGDNVGIEGDIFKVLKVVCWEDGVLVCDTDKVVKEILVSSPLHLVKAFACRDLEKHRQEVAKVRNSPNKNCITKIKEWCINRFKKERC